jgi:hypothetical protein
MTPDERELAVGLYKRLARECERRLVRAPGNLFLAETYIKHANLHLVEGAFSDGFVARWVSTVKVDLAERRVEIVQTTTSLRPPQNATFLLHCCLSKHDRECFLGDLEEDYKTVLKDFGPRRAGIFYWSQALRSIAPILWAGVKRSAIITAIIGSLDWLRG